jgi:hypothetical protein
MAKTRKPRSNTGVHFDQFLNSSSIPMFGIQPKLVDITSLPNLKHRFHKNNQSQHLSPWNHYFKTCVPW